MVHVVTNPLIQCKLSVMRDKETNDYNFRTCLEEIASMMTFEVFKNLETVETRDIETPTGAIIKKTKLAKPIILAPVLRAGIGMVDGVRKMIPNARVGHIGLFRDEKTLTPVEYYFKLPPEKNSTVVILDPMLATGGSIIAAIDDVKKHGYTDIRCICLIGAPEGKAAVEKAYPDIDIFIAALDDHLNEKGYIMPGLGDAGDRIFGTK